MTEEEKRRIQEQERARIQSERQRLEEERRKRIELNEQIKKGIGADNRPKK
jgi:hypothetical protein